MTAYTAEDYRVAQATVARLAYALQSRGEMPWFQQQLMQTNSPTPFSQLAQQFQGSAPPMAPGPSYAAHYAETPGALAQVQQQQQQQAATQEEPKEERGFLGRVFGSAWAGLKGSAGAVVGLKAASKASGNERSWGDYIKAATAGGFTSWLRNVTSDTGEEGGFKEGAAGGATMEFLSRNEKEVSFKNAVMGAVGGSVVTELADWGWGKLKSMVSSSPAPTPNMGFAAPAFG